MFMPTRRKTVEVGRVTARRLRGTTCCAATGYRGFRNAVTRQFLIGGSIGGLVAMVRSRGDLIVAFRESLLIGWFGLPDIDRRRVECVLDMRGIELLDHLDAGAAV